MKKQIGEMKPDRVISVYQMVEPETHYRYRSEKRIIQVALMDERNFFDKLTQCVCELGMIEKIVGVKSGMKNIPVNDYRKNQNQKGYPDNRQKPRDDIPDVIDSRLG